MFSLISPRLQKRVLSALIVMPVVVWMIWAGGIPFIILVTGCAAISLYEWFRLALKSRHKYFFMVAGLVYILVAFWSCYLIRINHGFENALGFVVMVWASDIGAYAVGKFFKGPKMAPNISPNKTWTGFAGAVLMPGICLIITILIYNYYVHGGEMPEPIFYMVLMIIGMIIGFVCQAGDLLVSLFKRHVQVKDAGDIIPGHGGLLDRVDSLMLAAPVYLAIIAAMSKFIVS